MFRCIFSFWTTINKIWYFITNNIMCHNNFWYYFLPYIIMLNVKQDMWVFGWKWVCMYSALVLGMIGFSLYFIYFIFWFGCLFFVLLLFVCWLRILLLSKLLKFNDGRCSLFFFYLGWVEYVMLDIWWIGSRFFNLNSVAYMFVGGLIKTRYNSLL